MTSNDVAQNSALNKALLRTKEVAKLLGISTTTLWRLEQTDPTFPRKIVLTSRCVGWRPETLNQWLADKESGL